MVLHKRRCETFCKGCFCSILSIAFMLYYQHSFSQLSSSWRHVASHYCLKQMAGYRHPKSQVIKLCFTGAALRSTVVLMHLFMQPLVLSNIYLYLELPLVKLCNSIMNYNKGNVHTITSPRCLLIIIEVCNLLHEEDMCGHDDKEATG